MNSYTVIALITVLLFMAPLTGIVNSAEPTIKQLLIKDAIKSYEDYGGYTKSDYREIYNPLKMFDNEKVTVNTTHSFWSQYSDSGFLINLNQPLNQSICSMELEVFNPKNSPYVLEIGGKTFNGSLDSTKVPINLGCIDKVDKFSFSFDADNKWTTISEIKLFTEKKIPPVEPPVCPPNSYWDEKLKKCVAIQNTSNGTTIVNSNLTFSVSNSSITVNADNSSELIFNIPPEIVEQIDPIVIDEDEDEDEKENDKN